MKLEPLHDNVIIRPADREERSKGGVFLPDSAREKPSRGEVLAVGPGKLLENGLRVTPAVVAGDVVYFSKYSAIEFDLAGDKVLIVPESSIQGKIVSD